MLINFSAQGTAARMSSPARGRKKLLDREWT